MSEYNDYHPIIRKAKLLAGENPEQVTREQIEKYVAKSREILRERTPEERAALEKKMDDDFREYMRRSRERNRADTLRKLATIQVNQRPKRFFGIKIGWWY